MKTRLHWMGMALLMAVGAGCDNSSQVADGGISGTGVVGTGVSMGPVEAFGSVRVNDTKLAVTPATEILSAGQPATEADLRVGQVVRIQADFDSAAAERIEYYEVLRGPLESISIINPETLLATLTVMGQTVITTAATNFESIAGVDLLQPGDVLEISGTRNAQSNIVASFVEKLPATGVYRVTGAVTNLSATIFDIAGTRIAYSAADTSALPAGTPQAGQIVRAAGTPARYSASPPELVATSLEPGLALSARADDSVETEGFVTRFTGPADFDVDGQPVDATNAVFVDGTAADLGTDTRVEVEGVINTANVLDASKVVIKPDDFIRIDATLDSVDQQNTALTVLGVVIEVPPQASIEDKRSGGGGQLNFGDLTAGMRVELRGFRDGARLAATRIEVEDPDSRVILLAPIDAFDEGSGTLSLLDLNIVARTALGTGFEDRADNPIMQSDFYAALSEGTLVKVRWDPFVNTSSPADEASLEQE